MKQFTIFSLLICILCSYVFAQNNVNKRATKYTPNKSKTDTSYIQHSKDSLVVSWQQLDEFSKLLQKEKGLSDYIPSVIPLLVGIISAVVLLAISKKQIGAQSHNIEEQLRTQEALARDQLQRSLDIALKQINANTRQLWINDTRNAVAELLSQAHLLNIEYQGKPVDIEKRKVIMEKFVFQKSKVFLLLNKNDPKHKMLIESLTKLITLLDMHLLKSNTNNNPDLTVGQTAFENGSFLELTTNVIEAARNIVYEEWQKIQS